MEAHKVSRSLSTKSGIQKYQRYCNIVPNVLLLYYYYIYYCITLYTLYMVDTIHNYYKARFEHILCNM